MNTRITTLAFALGALLLFYVLLFPKPQLNKTSALPTSVEQGGEGYHGLWRWLQAQHIPVLSLREHYEHLYDYDLPAAGNVLIVTVPQQTPARVAEVVQLEAWVEAGNTVLVMAALNDTPAWCLTAETDDMRTTLQYLTHLTFTTAEADDSEPKQQTAAPTEREANESVPARTLRTTIDALTATRNEVLRPLGAHPLMQNVQSIATLSEFPADHWRVAAANTAALLALGGRVNAQTDVMEPALWLKSQGKGQVVISAFASPISNHVLGKADNSRWLANVLAWSRDPQGSVIFDDAHQGLVSYYDPQRFFRDPRLHRTLAWMVLLWFVFVLGWRQFRPQHDTWQPLDATAIVQASGHYFASAITPAVAGQQLFVHFFNQLRRRLNLIENGEPVWGWLAQTNISHAQLQTLQTLYSQVQHKKSVNLIRIQTQLTQVMKQLT